MISFLVLLGIAGAGAGAMIASHLKSTHAAVSLVKHLVPEAKLNKHHLTVHNLVETRRTNNK